MKLVILLMLCAVAACAPQSQQKVDLADVDIPSENSVQDRNILVTILVNQLFNFLRLVIRNGFGALGIPQLDPLDLEKLHVTLTPNNLINLDLALEGAHSSGLGDFKVHTSKLDLKAMTFDLDISVPTLLINADLYDLTGDLFGALPLYGKGDSEFVVDGFRFQVLMHLKQSDDEKSVILESLENVAFQLSGLKVRLTGVIGGGNIDTIVNAIIEDVILSYVRRFHGAIAHLTSVAGVEVLNPVLEKLDTWKYIKPLL